MTPFRAAAGIGALIAVAGFAAAAMAWPTSSYTSNMMTYNRATCINRASAAMSAEGWQTRPTGGPDGQIGLLGHKEPSSAYILCLEASNAALPPGAVPTAGTIVVVFVSSTTANAAIAADEIAKLQQRMLAP